MTHESAALVLLAGIWVVMLVGCIIKRMTGRKRVWHNRWEREG